MKIIDIENVTLLQYAHSIDEMLLQYIKLGLAKKRKQPKKAKRKKLRYLRDEPAYNAGQENEFLFFISTLPFIVFNALLKSGLKLNKLKRDTKTIQDNIIEFTADPLKYIETHFNIDSTCDSLTTSPTWYNHRIRRKVKKKDHLKEHVTSTAKYNVVVAVDISKSKNKALN